MVKLSALLQECLIFLVQIYRYLLSPLFGPSCRFYPSCSTYAQIAIRRYGSFRGGYIAVRRLLRCHSWHSGGYDPVPSSCSGLSTKE